jgi:4-amino-4-deoxy-L-arabinose transferase-like glycosyltransferase
MEAIKKYREILLIVLLGLSFRLLAFLLAKPWLPEIVNTRILVYDAIGYHQLGLEIANSLSFNSTFRTPGYPMFIAMIYTLFGVKPWAVVLAQTFADTLTIGVIYFSGSRLFSRNAGLIASLFYAIDPVPSFHALTLNSETWFTFSLCVAGLLLIIGLQDRSQFSLLISGLLFGFATLIRPIAQYLVFIFVPIILAMPPLREMRRRVLLSAIFVLSFCLALSPWLWRNYSKYHTLGLSTVTGYNLLFYNAAFTVSIASSRPIEEVRDDLEKRTDAVTRKDEVNNPFLQERLYQDLGLKIMQENIKLYTWLHLKGMVNIFISPDSRLISNLLGIEPYRFADGTLLSTSLIQKIRLFFFYKPKPEIAIGLFVIVLLICSYSGVCIAVAKLVAEKRYLVLISILGIILYFSVLSGGPVGEARFRIPIIPIYLLLTGKGFSAFLAGNLEPVSP